MSKEKMPPEMKQLLIDCSSKDMEISIPAQKKLAKLLEPPLMYSAYDDLCSNVSQCVLEELKDAQ